MKWIVLEKYPYLELYKLWSLACANFRTRVHESGVQRMMYCAGEQGEEGFVNNAGLWYKPRGDWSSFAVNKTWFLWD